MRKTLLILTALIALSASAAFAGNADVVGAWDCDAYVDIIGETFTFVITVKEEEGELVGDMSGPSGSYDMRNAKYAEGNLTFDIMHEEAGRIDVKLKIEGDSFSGTAGNYDFTATVKGARKK